MLNEVLEGNHNPYSKEQFAEDAHLKLTIEKHYQKLLKMEGKKYSRPFMSESLADMAAMIGNMKNSQTTDALSKKSLGKSSDDDENDRQSIFSRFTQSKRPQGYFGT